MSDRTQKRVGHMRERELGRRGIRRGEMGMVSSYIDRVSYYISHGCLCVVRYMTMCTCIILIVNLPAE